MNESTDSIPPLSIATGQLSAHRELARAVYALCMGLEFYEDYELREQIENLAALAEKALRPIGYTGAPS